MNYLEKAYVDAFLTFGTHPPASVEQLRESLAAIPTQNIQSGTQRRMA